MESFRETGYYETTLEDIAGRLNVRKTALYHYFPDKESLLFECHRRSLDELEALLARARAKKSTARDRLEYVIREHVRVMTDTLEGSPSAFEVTALRPAHQQAIVERRDRYEHGLRQLIREGIEEGDFRPVDAKLAVFTMLGAINWIARWYRPDGSWRAPELGRDYADLLVGGLRCRS